MIFGLLGAGKKYDAFARQVAEEFIRSYPPDISQSVQNKRLVQKYNKVITRIDGMARIYGAEHKPGLYGRARVGNTFMWLLKDAGYEDPLIENVTNILLHSISLKK